MFNGGGDIMQTVLSMKMLKSLGKDDEDFDLGKLYLLQQMSVGEKLQVNDVLKSKLISKLKLDGDIDALSIDKLMLMQMLENGGNIDLSQVMMMKMLSKMFDEKAE